jgi:site-specific recombinase XerD
MLLTEFSKMFENIQNGNLRKSTMVRIYRPAFESFRKLVGDRNLREYTPLDVELFKSRRLETCAPTTVNIEFRALKAAFSLAVRLELIGASPFVKSSQLKVPDQLPLFLSEHEFRRLLGAVAEDRLKDLFVFAGLTGMRQGEILHLDWQSVEFERKLILVTNTRGFLTKNGKCRTIPMNETVHGILARLRASSADCGYVFESAGKPLTQSYVSHKFKHYVRVAGLNDRLKFHSLRHTFASWLVKKDVSIYQVQVLLGHSDVKTTQRYAHLAGAEMHSTVKRIDLAL